MHRDADHFVKKLAANPLGRKIAKSIPAA